VGDALNIKIVPLRVREKGKMLELSCNGGFVLQCFPLTCSYLILKHYLISKYKGKKTSYMSGSLGCLELNSVKVGRNYSCSIFIR
jgi:hypothetical protein